MVLDAVMIDQLIFKQDVEDRKQIQVMGVKTPHELLHNQESRNATPKRLLIKGSPKRQPMLKSQDNDTLHTQQTTAFKEEPDADTFATAKKARKTKISKQPVLALDKACLSCSGNMNQTIMQFKIACLSYVQQPVIYREKHYAVVELLKLRAKIIAACQRLLRANLKGNKNMGEAIRNRNDEEAFVIEPMLEIASLEDEANATFEDKLRTQMT